MNFQWILMEFSVNYVGKLSDFLLNILRKINVGNAQVYNTTQSSSIWAKRTCLCNLLKVAEYAKKVLAVGKKNSSEKGQELRETCAK